MTDVVLEKKFIRFENLIEDLAIAVNNGFVRLEEKIDMRFGEVDKRFDEIDIRFDRLENIVVAGHERRIEILEDNQRKFATKLNLDLRM